MIYLSVNNSLNVELYSGIFWYLTLIYLKCTNLKQIRTMKSQQMYHCYRYRLVCSSTRAAMMAAIALETTVCNSKSEIPTGCGFLVLPIFSFPLCILWLCIQIKQIIHTNKFRVIYKIFWLCLWSFSVVQIRAVIGTDRDSVHVLVLSYSYTLFFRRLHTQSTFHQNKSEKS